MYRDSKGGGANFDDPARFGLYRGQGLVWEFVDRFQERPDELKDLTESDNPCVTIPPNVGVQSGVYIFPVQVDWSDETYKIAYQRCCRNNTITNIVDPQATGAVFEIDITPEAQRSCNNSPTFNSFPPIVLCGNTPVDLDLSATDEEGDQLFYEFCLPNSSGGQDPGTGCTAIIPQPQNCLPPFGNVQFDLPIYSVNQPLGASANTNLNSVTGQLSLRPQVIGQFVVGVCVKEFRNGQLLSTVTRDFQFNIAVCEDLVTAEVETMEEGTTTAQNENLLTVESCFVKTIDFINQSTSQIGSPSYLWEFDVNGIKLQDNTTDATLTFPDVGTYFGSLIVNPEAGECSDTANLKVIIHPEIVADFTYDYDTCVAGPVEFYDQSFVDGMASITNWTWKVSPNDSTATQNPIHRYRNPGLKTIELIIKDTNECLDTISQDILWEPVPDLIVVEPSEFVGCAPIEVYFNNLSEPIDDNYTTSWDFGDGAIDSIVSPFHTYTEPGTYDVILEIISPENCLISRTYPLLIDVEEPPIADFTFSPDKSTSMDSKVYFTNTSQFVDGYEWRFGDGNFTFEENPEYTYQDTGFFDVTFIGYHRLGCSDTITKIVDVIPISSLHSPNAFTPNNDGLNDSFEPKGIFRGITDYKLNIWNRWGGLIFESEDIEIGWNGEMNNAGTPLPQGIYVYQLSYTEPRGKVVNQKGHLTLVR
jgi:gliding motility-associated-like protein